MPKKFYEEGIRFKCRGCGKCCTSRGEYGYVYLNMKESDAMAEVLKIAPHAFRKKYTTRTNGFLHLKDPELDCAFLGEGKCLVYDARPSQCRTWPFWRENLGKSVWERDIAPFCEGIGKGRLYSAEEIETADNEDDMDYIDVRKKP